MDCVPDDNQEPNASVSYCVMPGKGVVLISAPHAVEHRRKAAIKRAEPATGRLAQLLHDRVGCPVICRCGPSLEDPNYDEMSGYRDEIVRLVADEGIRLVFDLHEMGSHHESMVEIGTGHGRNTGGSAAAANAIVEAFEARGIGPVTVDMIFPAAGPHTVSADVARRSDAQCFQIEMNTGLFQPGNRSGGIEAVCRALEHAVRQYGGG